MKSRFKRILPILLLLAVLFCVYAQAGTISTTVTMRVSRMTQRAVINVGEDLSMEVGIDGANASAYQWYFNDELIPGANQKLYSIIDAEVEDTGIYRVDAYDESGHMLVSMDISARVIDPDVPKSGDTTMPVWIAGAVFILGASMLLASYRKKMHS